VFLQQLGRLDQQFERDFRVARLLLQWSDRFQQSDDVALAELLLFRGKVHAGRSFADPRREGNGSVTNSRRRSSSHAERENARAFRGLSVEGQGDMWFLVDICINGYTI